MRAITLDGFDSVPALRQLPDPEISAPDQVLVRVHAASINPFDRMVAAGALKGMMEHQFPVILGRDLAGVVEAVGPAVTRYAVGDEVFGFVGGMVLHDGSFADYFLSPEDTFIARKPARLDFLQAAALPVAGVAALLAVDAVQPGPGDVVLVVGATGGVGGYAVQLAAERGATVIATARPGDEAFVRDLGAAETVDYTGGDLAAAVRARHPQGIQALVDAVDDADAFSALAALVAPGGRAASVVGAANVEQLGEAGVSAANVMGQPDPALLGRLAELADSGKLRVPIQRVYPLDQATEGLDHGRSGHVRGKLAVAVAPS